MGFQRMILAQSLFLNTSIAGRPCLMDKARTGKTAMALRIATKVAETRKVLFIDFASTLRRFAEDNHTRFADSRKRGWNGWQSSDADTYVPFGLRKWRKTK